MAEAVYFVRSRGKVTGPFDLYALRKMVTRGSVSRIHEISADQQRWVAAGDVEQLFPAASPSGNGAAGPPRMPPQPPQNRFYYSQNGNTSGPLTTQDLRALAESGRLSAEALIWQEEAASATPAGNIPQLAELIRASQKVVEAPQPIASSDGRVRTHLLWSIVMTVLCPPVGLIALIQADKASECLRADDRPGAQAAARKARACCWFAAATDLVVAGVGGLLWVVYKGF